MKTLRSALASCLALALIAPAQTAPDLAVIHRLKQEAFNNSQVMETLLHLTDKNGHRLTGSPGYKTAADYVVARLKQYGIDNGHLEKFTFGRGWNYTRVSAHMIEPNVMPLIGFPMAWTPGTNGTITGDVIFAPFSPGAMDFAKWRGKLKDKIVLSAPLREFTLATTPQAKRYADNDLEELLKAPEPGTTPTRRPPTGGSAGGPPQSPESMRAARNLLNKFLREEGVKLVITPGYQGDYGTVFAAGGGSQDPKSEMPPPMLAIANEHYSSMVRLVQAKVPVKVEANIQADFIENADGFNVIAELKGSGPHKDEYVLIGGHLDSWHGATGATDNAAACAVMIETLRILKKLNVKLDRSVRIGLWGGEEQGLLGSKAYVKDHVADRETMKLGPDHGKLTGYFNIDNGAGKIRGIYTQNNEMIAPLFDQWIKPFKDLGVTHVTNRTTGGTDHLSFDAVGIPGFQFIQDPMDYMPRTHHSNMDTYDRVQKGDMLQMVAVLSSFVVNAANLDQKLPRKPLPEPEKKRNEEKKDAPSATASSAAGGQ